MHAPFRSTPWSLVLQAADPQTRDGKEALNRLIELSWEPLYAFLRRGGCAAQEAEDLVQGFFARLIEKKQLGGLSEGRGRFRNFLLVCLKRYCANERAKATAQKRGGTQRVVPLSADRWGDAETSYQVESKTDLTPERLFERRWGLATLNRALEELAAEQRGAGKGAQFAELRAYLTGEADAPPHAEVAERLGVSPGAVKTAIHRLRSRFRDTLCRVIGETLDRPELVEDELRRLFEAVRR